MIKNKKGFTILELMISMTLFAIIITSIILAVENMMIARSKTMNRITLIEQLYFFSEQLFSEIKDGGMIDYEEYWNRQSKGISTQSGHYRDATGVGNYGSGGNLGSTTYGTQIYLCRSSSGSTTPVSNMGSSGCLERNNNGGIGGSSGVVVDFSGSYQRYGQYLAQFSDYNGNADADLGDENNDSNIIGDDDDRAIGNAPSIATGSMQELYLINQAGKKRTYFRLNIQQDPNNTSILCNYPTNTTIATNSGCLGNIQILRLSGIDIGSSHSGSSGTNTGSAYDGVIDTWVCKESTLCSSNPIIPGINQNIATGRDGEWVNLFPSSINVKKISLQVFPVKNPWLSWAAADCSTTDPTCKSPFIHPYVRIHLEMGFAAGKRRTLKNEDPTISISTSISLADFQ